MRHARCRSPRARSRTTSAASENRCDGRASCRVVVGRARHDVDDRDQPPNQTAADAMCARSTITAGRAAGRGRARARRGRRREQRERRARTRRAAAAAASGRARRRAAGERHGQRDLHHEREPCPGGAAWRMPLPPRNASEQCEEDERARAAAAAPARRCGAPDEREDGEAAAGEDAEVVQRAQQNVAPAERHRRTEDGAGRGLPAPTANASTPSSWCPSSETMLHRTLYAPSASGFSGIVSSRPCAVALPASTERCVALSTAASRPRRARCRRRATVTAFGAFASTAPFAGSSGSASRRQRRPGRTSAATTGRGRRRALRERGYAGPLLALPLPCRSTSTAVRTGTSSR